MARKGEHLDHPAIVEWERKRFEMFVIASQLFHLPEVMPMLDELLPPPNEWYVLRGQDRESDGEVQGDESGRRVSASPAHPAAR